MTARTLQVLPLDDPHQLDQHDPLGRYFEWYWVPVVGPTAGWVYRALAGPLQLFETRDGYEVPAVELAQRVGVGERLEQLDRALSRLGMFELLHVQPGTGVLSVRRWAPSVTPRQLGRLPARVAERHAAVRAESLAGPVN